MSHAARLLIVRHAIALDREVAAKQGIDEAARPITDEGRERMVRAASGLAGFLPEIGIIAASPYRRAMETADILGEFYPAAQRVTLQVLVPGGDPEAVLAWRRGQPREACAAVVGHEPDLGELASAALAGTARSFVPMKKGGCCLIAFEEQVRAGRGELVWSLPPKVLRRLPAG